MTPPKIYYLNEISLVRFLWDCLGGQKPYLLVAQAIFPPLRRGLEWVARWAVRSGRAEHAVKLVPEVAAYWDYDRRCLLDDAFGKYEAWQDAYFAFNAADREEPAYAYGYRLIATNFMFTRVMPAYLLDALGRTVPDARIRGIPPEALDLCRQIFGAHSTARMTAISVPARLINALSTVSVLIFALGWTLSRVRWRVDAEDIFFAADYYAATKKDLLLFREVSDGGPVLMVMRARKAALGPDADQYRQCSPLDGVFTLTGAIEAVRMVLVDTARLWRRHGARTPPVYWSAVAMPCKRAIYRALFNRFRPKFFWGRDDYNVEHILRRTELARIGGTSMGISHAVMTNFCPRFPQWRYIHFDTYYTFSVALCAPYRDRWPSDMVLRSVGLDALPREALRQIPWPQGTDILIAMRMAWNEPEMIRVVHAVAKAFPAHRILVQFKVGYLSEGTLEATLAAAVARFRGDHSNIVHATGNIFDLIKQAKYVVSDVSTLVCEAIQLGRPTIFADVITGHTWSVFREFPDLSHTSAEAVVQRLQAWEDGREIFDRDGHMAFMELSDDRLIFDIIREDLGLRVTTDAAA